MKLREILEGLFCSKQGFAPVQYTLEFTMYPRLASDLQQSCLSLQSSGIIVMSRHTDLESKASREFLSAPSPLQWCCFHRSVSETHIKANTMFCSKAFGDTFCGLVLHYRRMSSQQCRFSSCPSRIIFLHFGPSAATELLKEPEKLSAKLLQVLYPFTFLTRCMECVLPSFYTWLTSTLPLKCRSLHFKASCHSLVS